MLRLELKVLDTLLKGAGLGVVYAQPPLSGEFLNEFWVESDETIEFLRILVDQEHL